MSKSKFIVFEGPDGSGKTTQLKKASDYLASKAIKHVTFSDPGSTKLGLTARELLKSGAVNDPVAELLLFSAARAELANSNIYPAMSKGYHVLCDRFELSTWVYQIQSGRYARYSSNWLRALPQLTVAMDPDAYLIFTADDKTLDERLSRRGDLEPDAFETPDYTYRVRAEYRYWAEQGTFRGYGIYSRSRIHAVDAAPDQETVSASVVEVLNKILEIK